MTEDEKQKARAEILANTMIANGVLKWIGPDKYEVISYDVARVAACLEQAEREWQIREN
jgi:hypothetical protein